MSYDLRAELVPEDVEWRPAPLPRPRIDGPQIATVVGPAGEEIHCDEWGRVKVQFPWDREGRHDEQVIRAGGELTTNGLLDIRASEWTNSSVLQAGRLNLDIGTFRQTAEGKLLAVQSFTGRGGDWSNDGLLASDGSLRTARSSATANS